ncbi:MAG TPA: Crp/Fnr family transcriptional regulator [Candidatus Acidoferrum sp.]|nr:Crp/Fnr family transcriptional regulator [Candidatus Acidoferrum sp.]
MKSRVKNTKTAKPAGTLQPASLSGNELFCGLPVTSLQSLEKSTKVLQVQAGHVFFRPGQRGEVLYCLEQGRAQTFRISGRKKLIIEDLKPPAVFGEMGCVGLRTYHCFAQTIETSRVRMVSRTQLEMLAREFPVVTQRLLDLVSARFVHVLLDLEATSFRHLIPRLAKLLLERSDGGTIRGITHRELAELLRVYRESATAALGELRKAGIVALERKQILILDHNRLERAARE